MRCTLKYVDRQLPLKPIKVSHTVTLPKTQKRLSLPLSLCVSLYLPLRLDPFSLSPAHNMLLKLAGLAAWLLCAISLVFGIVSAEDPYRFFDWNVTYGDIYPLGVRQQVHRVFRVLLFSPHLICCERGNSFHCHVSCFFWVRCREFSSMANSRGRRYTPLPMTTSS